MEPVLVTPESFASALNWINGIETDIQESEVKSIIDRMAVGYRRRYRELYPWGTRPQLQPTATNLPTIENICGPEAADLMARIVKEQNERRSAELAAAELKSRTPEPVMNEEKKSSLDSVLMINSISHIASDAGESITSSRAQIILYCIYGAYLAHTGSRLDIEHPQAWKYGPVFPRAYKKGSLSDNGLCAESYDILKESRPDIAEALSSKTESMLHTPMTDLNICHKGESSPYGKTVKKNPDRWGIQIEDNLIKDFFSRARG